jgi:hypothetical protein
MIDLILMAVFFSIGGLLVLAGFTIWSLRDVIGYVVEVVFFMAQSLVKLIIQGAVALVELADELLEDWDIAEEPLLRVLLLGSVGLLLGVTLTMLLAMVKGQPWVILTLSGAVAGDMGLGLLADPDKDWSLGAFPSFPRRGGGGPKLPLNL